MRIDESTLKAAHMHGRWLSVNTRADADAVARYLDYCCEYVAAEYGPADRELVVQLSEWLGADLAKIRHEGTETVIGEAITRFGKQFSEVVNAGLAQGNFERVEKTNEDILLEAARKDIEAQSHVVGLIDGSVPGEFIVLTFAEHESGDQAMTLETWTADGPMGESPAEFTVAFRPDHLDALAFLMTEGRKNLEADGKVAVPGTEN